MKMTSTEKYFLFVLLLMAVVFTVIVFYPFLAMLILAAAFSAVLYPIYSWINNHLTRGISWLASFITVVLFLICLCVPLFFIGKTVFNEVQNMYTGIMSNGGSTHFISSIEESITKILPSGFNFDIHQKLMQFVSSMSDNLVKFFSSTVNSLIMFILMALTIFYLLEDGEMWKKELINILPMSDENAHEILTNLKISIDQVFKGSFIMGIAQGLFAWAGFVVFGVPNALFWALVTFVASFAPTIGTSFITIPASIFLFATGMHWHAVGLFFWSVFIVGTVDNLIAPYVISKNTNIPPLFILFAILGGLSIWGGIGILIGPLVLSFLYSLIIIYKKDSRI